MCIRDRYNRSSDELALSFARRDYSGSRYTAVAPTPIHAAGHVVHDCKYAFQAREENMPECRMLFNVNHL